MKVQRHAQNGIQLKVRPQYLTLLMILCCAHKQEPSMTALQKAQQRAKKKSDVDIYTQPMDRSW
jgi:predicted amino acid-binding ACT domain protein